MITVVNPSLPYGFAKQHGVVLLDHGETATVGLREGADRMALLEARRVLGCPLVASVLDRAAFDRRLSEVYGGGDMEARSSADDLDMPVGLEGLADELPAVADLLDSADDAPIIRLINGVIAQAVRTGASDIHVEPFEETLAIRLRVDGVLREVLRLNARVAALLTSRIKVMARLDIAEKRVPQDGRIALALGGKTLDVRVSTLPSRAGERVVLRILDKDQAGLRLDQLGMNARSQAAFAEALREPNGIILVTGPTGSGKTTSLYAGLMALNDSSRNILTVEDPVEYAIEGVGQTQVNAKVGMTFAAGLRAILRQDPDVVMVGEVRDPETAQVAVQASLTGHLVLSTVHTNDAVGAVVRLRDLGVEPFLLASTLRLVVAQRLVRRLCPECRTRDQGEAATVGGFGRAWRPRGCPRCNHAGYIGRIGVYETLRIDDQLRRLIAAGAPEDALEQAAFAEGGTLAEAVRTLVRDGETSMEEALRITRPATAARDAA